MNYQGPVRPSSQAEASIMEATAGFLARAKESSDGADLEGALFDLENALCLMPNSPHAHWNRAQVLLALGDYAEGFREFEWRLHLFGNPLARVDVPQWRGENLAGKNLLLCHEHGYGDCLMMLRYVPVLKDMGANVTFLVPRPLERLASSLGVDVKSSWPNDFCGFDYCCLMFSVMAALGHEVQDVPSEPYLNARAGERLPNSLGVAWSGNPANTNNARRSLSIGHLLDGLGYANAAVYSVQSEVNDFFETAALMARLDHIVTVDTAAAHLAGAIGHPSVHLLLPHSPDWRWYSSHAWYPTIHCYRQETAGDWSAPLERIRRRLNA